MDVSEFDDQRLCWSDDELCECFHVIVSSPLNLEVLEEFGDSHLDLELRKSFADAHPRSVAEIPD